MVVTSNGLPFTSIDVRGGVMSLALKQKAVFSRERPYRFTIKAEAEGYSSNVRNILVSSEEGQYVPIFMAKLETPPAGMASVAGSFSLAAGVVNADASLTAIAPPVSNGVPTGNIRVEIPKGAIPIYCDRNNPNTPFPKQLNFRVSYASPRSLAAGRTFPGGALVTDAVDASGTTVASPGSPMFFSSAGWMNFDMDADGNAVSGFTKPVAVTMPVPDSLLNRAVLQSERQN
jgi:hypothetical protein